MCSSFKPPFVLFILSFWLCQQYCTVQHSGVFDKKKEKKKDGTCWADQNSFLDCPISSPHIPSPNHILFFYISCVYMYSASVRPVVDISLPAHQLSIVLMTRRRMTINTGRRTTAHVSIDTFPLIKLLTPPPVNMNVTCILCIYTIEIQHISPRYTLYPHMYRH